jgi:hypothetical protein
MSATTATPKLFSYDHQRGTQEASLGQLLCLAITQVDLGNTNTNNTVTNVVGGQPRSWDFPLNFERYHMVAFVIKNKENGEVTIVKVYINLTNP